jgi:2-(1,2-epoxy-1,2-dihydrophenyl)acetyl-CoA isomerase
MNPELLTETQGAVARITFNRPAARNSVNRPMLLEMQKFLQSIEADARIRCIVLSGAGEHFMAGADITGFQEALQRNGDERRSEFEARIQATIPLFLQLARMPQPLVAKVQGAAAGAALGFIGGADFAICGASAVFILAHVNVGLSPDASASFYLPRVIGVRKAKELAILGQKLTAPEALELGLVNRVVPDAELDAATALLVEKIVAAPAASVRRAKLLMDQSLNNNLETQLSLEARCFGECAGTADFVEGVGAFMGKRKAGFNRGE